MQKVGTIQKWLFPSQEETSKKKALKATWDDSSASEEEESNTEQVAHYALMAIGEEVTNLLDADLSFDELLNAFHDLFDECKIINRKYKLLKKEHDSLTCDFDKLKTKYHDSLNSCIKCHDLETLQKENLLLKDTLKKFEVGSKSLNMILANKGHVPKRSGIGFVRSPHQNPTTFIKGPILHVRHQSKCNFCCKLGHKTHYCPFKKISPNKLIWVPKGTMINSIQHNKQCRSIFEAPKSKWVPKNHPFL